MVDFRGMKTNAILLAAALCAAAPAFAEPVPAEGAEAGAFLQDVDAARALAKEKGLPLLLDFTGSDWCGYCQWMDREVFSKDEWKAWAATGIVAAMIDFPADAASARGHIPMKGSIESLNAAMAAGILLFEAARQRRNG